jgi:hypothetical protein
LLLFVSTIFARHPLGQSNATLSHVINGSRVDMGLQCFSLTPVQHQPPASQQYFSLTINQLQPPATNQSNEAMVSNFEQV